MASVRGERLPGEGHVRRPGRPARLSEPKGEQTSWVEPSARSRGGKSLALGSVFWKEPSLAAHRVVLLASVLPSVWGRAGVTRGAAKGQRQDVPVEGTGWAKGPIRDE